MMTLVVYDVNTESAAGQARLRKIAKRCLDFGQRVQNSVFEVNVDYAKVIALKNDLVKIIDAEKDSLRFYYLGNRWQNKIEVFGLVNGCDSEGFLMI